MKKPRYPIEWADAEDGEPKIKRAAQEVAPYNYRADAAMDYYDRHPEHWPHPLSRRQARRRLIREGY